jgi:hypothetical protein
MNHRHAVGTDPLADLIAAVRRAGLPLGPRSDPHAPERPQAPRRSFPLSADTQDAIVRRVLYAGGYPDLVQQFPCSECG